ncbi:hypothetical protein ACQR16_30085 [Bradyrhizobium oligotrophicum]|uniref:hypothetical protein n=1 Tax=Bradyrhizobium oligotrophicum TaxID=44255 RepID=UPI003EB9C2E8
MSEQIPEPWYLLADDDLRAALEAELARELSPRHVLAGLSVHIIAKRDDCDRVLGALNDGRVAQIHLTWTGRREHGPRWPETTVYNSMDEWRIASASES